VTGVRKRETGVSTSLSDRSKEKGDRHFDFAQ